MPRKHASSKTSPKLSRFCALALVASFAAADAGTASAQDRIAPRWLPDLDFYQPSMADRDRGDKAPNPRALWEFSATVGRELGDQAGDRPGHSGVANQGRAKLRWGMRPNRVTSLQMRSELSTEESSGDSLTGLVAGRHDGRVHVGTSATNRAFGFDLVGRGHVRHLGNRRRALFPVEVGPGAHIDSGLEVAMAARQTPKESGDEVGGMQLPITAGVRRIDYASADSPVARATEKSASIGLGGVLFHVHAVRFSIDVIGVSRRELTIEPSGSRGGQPSGGSAGNDGVTAGDTSAASGAEAAADGANAIGDVLASPLQLNRTSLHIGRFDAAFLVDQVTWAASGQTGWTWIRDPGSNRRVNLFTMHYGAELQAKERDMDLTWGLAFGRDGAISADGQRLMAEYRVESHFALALENYGGSLRGAASWFTDKEADDGDDPGVAGLYAVHSEIFHRLPGDMHSFVIGAYNLAAYQSHAQGAAGAWNPWQNARDWRVEFGAFLRWSGES